MITNKKTGGITIDATRFPTYFFRRFSRSIYQQGDERFTLTLTQPNDDWTSDCNPWDRAFCHGSSSDNSLRYW